MAATAEEQVIESVLVLFAMAAEAAPFVLHAGLTPAQGLLPSQLSCAVFTGVSHGVRLTVVTSGTDRVHGVDAVGTVPAALAAFAALQAFKPDLFVNAGTAGGFKALGGAVGDVYLATGTRHHDRRIPIPGFAEFGVYHLEAPSTPKLVAALGLKAGVVTTGNSLGASEEDLALFAESGAAVKDMEAASLAYVASLFGTPLLAVKAVTDIVDGERSTAEEFAENLAAAAAALQRALPRLIAFIAGKRLCDL